MTIYSCYKLYQQLCVVPLREDCMLFVLKDILAVADAKESSQYLVSAGAYHILYKTFEGQMFAAFA